MDTGWVLLLLSLKYDIDFLLPLCFTFILYSSAIFKPDTLYLFAPCPPRAFPYFSSLRLILVAVTFFWYGGEKGLTTPHPQLLSGETRAATCQRTTTQPHAVAFSVADIRGEIVHKTYSSITSTSILSLQLFLSHLFPMCRSGCLKVKTGLKSLFMGCVKSDLTLTLSYIVFKLE